MQQNNIDPELNQIINSLSDFNLGDVIRTKDAGMPIASFVLGCCFIDHLSRIAYYDIKMTDAERFAAFIYNYFPHEYKGIEKELYVYLRSKLVHNYSVKGTFYLDYDSRTKHKHLDKNTDGRIHLNIEKFVDALKFSFCIFKDQIECDVGKARINALNHNKKYPILIIKNV